MAVQSVSKTSPILKILGWFFGLPLKMLTSWKVFRISLFGIFMFALIISSVIEAVNQKSIEPIVDQIGGGVVGADIRLKENTDKFIEHNAELNLWEKTKMWWNMFSCLYFLYFMLWVFFWVVKKVGNDSTNQQALIISFLIVLVLQFLWSWYEFDKGRITSLRIPFSGVIYFFGCGILGSFAPSIRDGIKSVYDFIGRIL